MDYSEESLVLPNDVLDWLLGELIIRVTEFPLETSFRIIKEIIASTPGDNLYLLIEGLLSLVPYISDLERGLSYPSLNTIYKLAEILKQKPHELIQRVDVLMKI